MKQLSALSLPLCLALACSSASASSAGSADDPRAERRSQAEVRSEIESLGQSIEDAWNAHDAEAHAALFLPEATLVTPMGSRVSGRGDILAMFSSPGPTKQTSTEIEIEAIEILGPDLVFFDAVQTLSGPGTEAVGTQARLAAVARRVDGEWRLLAARPCVPVSR